MLSAFLMCVIAADPAAPVFDIERAFLKNLEAIKNGRIVVRADLDRYGERPLHRIVEMELTLNGESICCLHRNNLLDIANKRVGDEREWLCDYYVWHENRYISDGVDTGMKGANAVVLWEDNVAREALRSQTYDIRTVGSQFGMVPGRRRLDWIVGNAERVSSSETIEVVDGEELHKIEYTLPDGMHRTLWLSERQGPGLVRYLSNDATSGDSYECKIENAEFKGGWYFRSAEFKGTGPEGELVLTKKIEVREATFNYEIAPDLFGIQGLKLQPGRKVSKNGEGKLYIWDGEQLILED